MVEKKIMCKEGDAQVSSHKYMSVIGLKKGYIYYMRDMGNYVLINEKDGILGGVWFNWKMFSEYFYTPEETINILRTELIDKILL